MMGSPNRLTSNNNNNDDDNYSKEEGHEKKRSLLSCYSDHRDDNNNPQQHDDYKPKEGLGEPNKKNKISTAINSAKTGNNKVATTDLLLDSLIATMPRKELEALAKAAIIGGGKESVVDHLEYKRTVFVASLSFVIQNDWLQPQELLMLDSTCKAARGGSASNWPTQDSVAWKHMTITSLKGGETTLNKMDISTLLSRFGGSYRSFFANPLAWLAFQMERIRVTEPVWATPWKRDSSPNHGTPRDGSTSESPHKTLLDRVQEEISTISTTYGTGFFLNYDENKYHCWADEHRVNHDDLAIVIANALVQPGCHYKNLYLGSAVRCNMSPLGYKAIAYAVGYNTSLISITRNQFSAWPHSYGPRHPGDADNPIRTNMICGSRCHPRLHGVMNLHDYDTDDIDELEETYHITADYSGGLFAKALALNKEKSGALTTLMFCPNHFGLYAQVKLNSIKPGLVMSIRSTDRSTMLKELSSKRRSILLSHYDDEEEEEEED